MKRIRIGGGVFIFALFLLLGGYRYMDIGIALSWFISAICHELGHYFAARLLGVKVERLTLDAFGARMVLSGGVLSYGKEALIAAAGPFVNIIIALISFSSVRLLAELSIVLGVLNLIPAPLFDGYRILSSVLYGIIGCEKGGAVMKIISFFAVIFIWLIAVYALLRYKAGFSLFVLSFTLLSGLFKS